MFYLFSKTAWFVFRPSVFILLLLLVSLSWAFWFRSRLSVGLAATAAAFFLAATLTEFGSFLLKPLEQRFVYKRPDQAPFGIIALGGDDGGRLTALVALSKEFGAARILYSGAGQHDLLQMYGDLGGDASRVLRESSSRTTDEDARYSAELVKPTPDQRWLLITSAAHMPRAIGCFRKAGFQVDAYPVSFLTTQGLDGRRPSLNRREQLDFAVKEWIGLIAYRLFQKTDALFPGPELNATHASSRVLAQPR